MLQAYIHSIANREHNTATNKIKRRKGGKIITSLKINYENSFIKLTSAATVKDNERERELNTKFFL